MRLADEVNANLKWSADILSASVRSTLSLSKKITLKVLFALGARADGMSALPFRAKPLFSLISFSHVMGQV